MWTSVEPSLAPKAFEALFVASLLAAWAGGLGPGLLATAVCWVVGARFLLNEPFSFAAALEVAKSTMFLPFGVCATVVVSVAARGGTIVRSYGQSGVDLIARLRTARNQALAASRAKSEYLANLTHEIRTPLSAILGFSELLLEPQQSSEERLNFVKIIRRNGELLSQIIGNVLDLSKIEAGRMELETLPVNVKQLVSEVAESLSFRALKKGLTIETNFKGLQSNLEVRTDPTRLRQIIVNVVGNAVKFTERGGIFIEVNSMPEAGSPTCRIEFLIRDTGIGFSTEQRSRLFQFFTQADTATSRKYGGTGLGLCLARQLARLLGGDLELAQTEPGAGSTFRITLSGQSVRTPPVDVEAARKGLARLSEGFSTFPATT